MAEAFCRQMANDIECASAGSSPEKEVSPAAVMVMKEIGIDISNAKPKGFSDLPDLKFDYLVTMGCDVACPFLPGAKQINWEIPDPKGKGLEEYRRVRELIKQQVQRLLQNLQKEEK